MEPVKLRLRKRSGTANGCKEYELSSPIKKEFRLKAEKENSMIEPTKKRSKEKKIEDESSVLREFFISSPKSSTLKLHDSSSSSLSSDESSDFDDLENILFRLKERGIKTVNSHFSGSKYSSKKYFSSIKKDSNLDIDKKCKKKSSEKFSTSPKSEKIVRKTNKIINNEVDKVKSTPVSHTNKIRRGKSSNLEPDQNNYQIKSVEKLDKKREKSNRVKKNLKFDSGAEGIDLKELTKNSKKIINNENNTKQEIVNLDCNIKIKNLKDSNEINDLQENKSLEKLSNTCIPELEKQPEELILNYKRVSKQVNRYEVECTPQKLKIANTPTKSLSKSKRKSVALQEKFLQDEETTPKRKSTRLTPLKLSLTKSRESFLVKTPTNKIVRKLPTTPLEKARNSLHLSSFPEVLPCREKEYNNIETFVKNKILDGIGGCMYISGVPGTGKTATVTQVMKNLKSSADNKEIPEFKYIEINGLRLSDPRQVYVQIWQKLFDTEERILADKAQKFLDSWFSQNDKKNKKKTTVLLVDELDLICTRKQDVVYNLLEWPTRTYSRLVVLTIANTMDMPERLFKNRITSRMGLTRVTFLPYTFRQLENIVFERLKDLNAFLPDAIQLVTRKVAAVSGDARRALDICRRATELPAPDEIVKMNHIEEAIKEMTNSNIVRVIRDCSQLEKLFLRSLCDVTFRSNIEEIELFKVIDQLLSICVLEGFPRPSVTSILAVCHRLKCSRLIFSNQSLSGILQRVMLNVTQDDIHYALQT